MINKPNEQQTDAGLTALQDALRGVFLLVRIAAVLLLLGFCVSGIRNIEQYEKAVVLRFGSVSGAVREDPGMIVALPYPVDSVVTIPAKRTRSITTKAFTFKISDQEKATGVPSIPRHLTPGRDGALITADGGLLHGEATVKYRIEDPVSWQFETAEAEKLLLLALERTMIHAIATRNAREALQDKPDLQRQITAELESYCDRLRLGVDLDPVELTLAWPRQLTKVIDDVISAGSEADSARNAARLFESTHANKAESQAAAILATAATDATRVKSRAKAEADTFKELQPLYHENPTLVRRMLYQERMRTILAGVDELIVVDGKKSELRLTVPRDNRKKATVEEEKE